MLTQREKLIFEHLVMTIFQKTPSQITSYNADDISANAYLQVGDKGSRHSLHIHARDGKLDWHFDESVDDYTKDFVERVIRKDPDTLQLLPDWTEE